MKDSEVIVEEVKNEWWGTIIHRPPNVRGNKILLPFDPLDRFESNSPRLNVQFPTRKPCHQEVRPIEHQRRSTSHPTSGNKIITYRLFEEKYLLSLGASVPVGTRRFPKASIPSSD